MRIKKVAVKNFRLLKDIEISLEDTTTVLVGRNNSGKTSLTELFRRILTNDSINFLLEDFNLSVYEKFREAFNFHERSGSSNEVENSIPFIELKLWIDYDITSSDIGPLSEFLIDLDIDSNEVIIRFRYEVKENEIGNLFSDLQNDDIFFKLIKERINKCFALNLLAIDPTDNTNTKRVELKEFQKLLKTNFINAQRGLDDTTHKEKDFLGKFLEKIFEVADIENALSDESSVNRIKNVVQELQNKIDTDFNENLNQLIPALKLFGYPGLNDPELKTETTLDVQRLLSSHTKIKNLGNGGISLPETYNGLGSRNLIYILFQLYEFFKSFQTQSSLPGVHLIFIEEPEAHLHPQMQEVFIRQLGEIAKRFSKEMSDDYEWPVQFVVSTHSTHLANEAPFDFVRYFLNQQGTHQQVCVKDFHSKFNQEGFAEDKIFLQKYMTLTRCDLFFADKAILIEGTTERLILPEMIKKVDKEGISANELSSQYISVIEIGGAYAHKFYGLLDFLELPTLIITDLDSVKQEEGRGQPKKCKVSEGTNTSNPILRNWFDDSSISPEGLLAKSEDEKTKHNLRLSYQISEDRIGICGRSFEDAFMLANQDIFDVLEVADEKKESFVYKEAQNIQKTDFALKYSTEVENWAVPKYIKEGLCWLADCQSTT